MDIKQRDRNQLKAHFVKRAVPSEKDFAELIDGMLNQKDDRVVKSPGHPLSLEAVGDAASRRQVLDVYETFDDNHPAWSLSLNPRAVVSDPGTANPGLGIDDGSGLSRLFIDSDSGHVGIGTVEPRARLDVHGDARVESALRIGGEVRVDGAMHIAGAVHVTPGALAQEPWIDATLEPAGKWKYAGGDFRGHPFNQPGYFKDSQSIVHLRGWISGGTVAQGTVIFKLPAGYRPAAAEILIVHSAGKSASILALPDGDVVCWTYITGGIVLDNLRFRAAS